MSIQSFMSRRRKDLGRFAFALLVGVVLVLPQCLLPSTAFAQSKSSSGATASPYIYRPGQDQALDTAGAAVVRLVATYADVKQTITCTGLGILVGSTQLAGNINVPTAYQNTVLTDGNLLNTTASACGRAGGSSILTSIQVLTSAAYNNSTAGYALSQLACHAPAPNQISCEDGKGGTTTFTVASSTDGSKFCTLFTFQTSVPQPFIAVNLTTATSQGLTKNVGLTDSTEQVFPAPTLTNNTLSAPEEYLQPRFISFLNNPVSTNNNPTVIESGTPVIDATGEIIGLYLVNGTEFNLAQANLTGLPPAGATNPLQTVWNQGMQAYYAGQYQIADRFFKAALAANPNFTGAHIFDALALSKLQPVNVTPTAAKGTTTPVVSPPPTNMTSRLLLAGLGVGLIVLIALLVLVMTLGGRARRRRRELAKFEAEQAEARRIAEAEMNHLPPPFQTGDVACPNCLWPVRTTNESCPHCHFQLSPSDSGLHVRRTGPTVQLPGQPMPGYPLPPASAPSISEQPTVQFLPPTAPVMHEEPGAGEKTVIKRRQNHDPDVTLAYDVQQMRGHKLGLSVSTRSDPGIKRKHKPNEDSLFAMQGARTHNSLPQQFGLFVVADGMGGHANGQDASRLAIQTIIDFMLPRISSSGQLNDEEFQALLGEGVQAANQAVHNRNLEEHADMGTTMTAALVVAPMAYVANVGDSRTYLYREGQGLSKVTNDHSVVASLVEAGIIQPDDIYTHPKRNQIYRSLGEKAIVEVDTFAVKLQAGDKLLLCSDGLWDMVRDPLIQKVLSNPRGDLDQAGQDLIKAALQGGGEDNVSVIVVQFAEINEHTGMTGIRLLAKPESVTVPNLPPIK